MRKIIPIIILSLIAAFFIAALNKGLDDFPEYQAITLTKPEKKQVSILAFGDLMLDRNVYSKTKKAGDFYHPFLNLDGFLRSADIKLANLEGPITNFESISIKDNRMRFTISPDFLKPLKDYFNILSLANNHMLDWGEEGFGQSKEFLTQSGIEFFGDYKNRSQEISKIIEKNRIKIGFVGYHALISNDISEIVKEITNLKTQTDFIIVFTHWGREYEIEPLFKQKEQARAFIDAGADLVLGSHPHVIGPVEIYKDKFIFYSLGNFIFDQYFSQATMEGLSVKILLEKYRGKTSVSYELFPININYQSQAELANF